MFTTAKPDMVFIARLNKVLSEIVAQQPAFEAVAKTLPRDFDIQLRRFNSSALSLATLMRVYAGYPLLRELLAHKDLATTFPLLTQYAVGHPENRETRGMFAGTQGLLLFERTYGGSA